MEKNFNLTALVNNDGCFDLQFRKDTRHERTGSPTYWRWKVQFIITVPKENIKILEKTKKLFSCGNISIAKPFGLSRGGGQARFSVQKIDDLIETIIPYFNKKTLVDKKKKDFLLWQKAVNIIYQNKGIYISKWKRSNLLQLIEIHKTMAKYKNKPKPQKWLAMAKNFAKTL